MATLESTVVPMNMELKKQMTDMECRLEKSQGYFKSLGTAQD